MENLKIKLSAYGNILSIKEGVVFTVFLTGTGLDKMHKVKGIQDLIMDYASEKYPFIEVLRNDSNYFLVVLKP